MALLFYTMVLLFHTRTVRLIRYDCGTILHDCSAILHNCSAILHDCSAILYDGTAILYATAKIIPRLEGRQLLHHLHIDTDLDTDWLIGLVTSLRTLAAAVRCQALPDPGCR